MTLKNSCVFSQGGMRGLVKCIEDGKANRGSELLRLCFP